MNIGACQGCQNGARRHVGMRIIKRNIYNWFLTLVKKNVVFRAVLLHGSARNCCYFTTGMLCNVSTLRDTMIVVDCGFSFPFINLSCSLQS